MLNIKSFLKFSLFFLVLGSVAQAEVSPIGLRVDQVSKSITEGGKKTVKRSLNVHIANNSSETQTMTAKYILFGRDAATGDILVMDSGDQSATVKSRSTELIETTAATAVFNEAKMTANKRVPASGAKFVGYGVRVMSGEKVVAEAYDPASLKESWGKAVQAPKQK